MTLDSLTSRSKPENSMTKLSNDRLFNSENSVNFFSVKYFFSDRIFREPKFRERKFDDGTFIAKKNFRQERLKMQAVLS